jgi:hypothetical protein
MNQSKKRNLFKNTRSKRSSINQSWRTTTVVTN